MFDTDVLIVGAGPVGLTLALDLGRRGIACRLIERKPSPQFLPKMERCNARTMEIFRRMGLADRVRAAGLRADVPMDVYVALALNERPLLHLPYPSVAQARETIAQCRDGSMPLEPYQLISQYTLEPLLVDALREYPSVDLTFSTEFVSLAQTSHAVTARVRTAGCEAAIAARYLIGCDGGSSAVRRHLGIDLSGDAGLAQLYQGLYHCPDLFGMLPIGEGPGPGRHYHIADAHSTFLIMQDSTRHWTLHASVAEAADMGPQFERAVGVPVRYELLHAAPWKLNLLLADRYRDGRVFLAGDAVHLVIPTGGLGMNSGVGDAVDLGWKIAGTIQGWGGPGLLDSYERERRPIGARNIAASRQAFLGRREWRRQYRPEIRDATPEGARARAHLAGVANVEQRKSNDMIGAELGYRYDASPLICHEPDPPDVPLREYIPSTWPGARLPHVWLDDGRAIQDHLGDEYAILRLGGTEADTAPLEQALRAVGAPARTLTIADRTVRDVYGVDLLLLRPDLHVAWRGNVPPADAAALAARVTGHA